MILSCGTWKNIASVLSVQTVGNSAEYCIEPIKHQEKGLESVQLQLLCQGAFAWNVVIIKFVFVVIPGTKLDRKYRWSFSYPLTAFHIQKLPSFRASLILYVKVDM